MFSAVLCAMTSGGNLQEKSASTSEKVHIWGTFTLLIVHFMVNMFYIFFVTFSAVSVFSDSLNFFD